MYFFYPITLKLEFRVVSTHNSYIFPFFGFEGFNICSGNAAPTVEEGIDKQNEKRSN